MERKVGQIQMTSRIPVFELGNDSVSGPFPIQATEQGYTVLSTGQTLGWFQAGTYGNYYGVFVDDELEAIGSPFIIVDQSEETSTGENLQINALADGAFVVSYNERTGYDRTVKIFDADLNQTRTSYGGDAYLETFVDTAYLGGLGVAFGRFGGIYTINQDSYLTELTTPLYFGGAPDSAVSSESGQYIILGYGGSGIQNAGALEVMDLQTSQIRQIDSSGDQYHSTGGSSRIEVEFIAVTSLLLRGVVSQKDHRT